MSVDLPTDTETLVEAWRPPSAARFQPLAAQPGGPVVLALCCLLIGRPLLAQVLVKGNEKLEREREEKRSQGWSTGFGEPAEGAEAGLPSAARFAIRCGFDAEEGGWRITQLRRVENVQVGRE